MELADKRDMVVRHSPSGKSIPKRTISTRQHPITFGSQEQNPVAPKNTNKMSGADNQNTTSANTHPELDSANRTRVDLGTPQRHILDTEAEQESTAANETGNMEENPGNSMASETHTPSTISGSHSTGSGMQLPQVVPFIWSMEDFRNMMTALKAPAAPMPEFSGYDHEEPKKFLDECEGYFKTANMDKANWTRTAGKQPQDNPKKWWSAYKTFGLDWARFREQLMNQYSSRSVLTLLRTTLYPMKQAQKETASLFLQREYMLGKRLYPNSTEEDIRADILETLKPSIKRIIRAANPKTLTDLPNRATIAEADEAEYTGKKTSTLAPSPPSVHRGKRGQRTR